MKISFFLGSLALALSAATAAATTYNGNGGSSFGGPIGGGTLTFTANATTLTGTITPGPGGFNDELVIYLDTKSGGFTNTSTFTDTGANGTDAIHQAISGYNGTSRAPLNFANGFAADYAFSLSPAKAQFGGLFTLDNVAGFTYGSDNTNGNATLTPTGTGTSTTYTFSIALTVIGTPTFFNFATTYLNGTTAFRSNEAIGNTISDVTTPSNTGNVGQDTGLVGSSSFIVPEPGTWAALVVGAGLLVSVQQRRRQG